jgi:hypothetical protein
MLDFEEKRGIVKGHPTTPGSEAQQRAITIRASIIALAHLISRMDGVDTADEGPIEPESEEHPPPGSNQPVPGRGGQPAPPPRLSRLSRLLWRQEGGGTHNSASL